MKKVLKKNINDDGTYDGSMIDEIKRNYSKSKIITFPFPPELIFMSIIKVSFTDFKGVNWKNYKDLKIGDFFKSRMLNTKYKLTDFEIEKIYELNVVIEGIEYWIRYELSKYKINKTKVKYEQSVLNKKTIQGFRGQIAKINFTKEFEKRSLVIAENIHNFAKELSNENKNTK